MFNQWCFYFLPFIAESLSLKLGPQGAGRSIGSLQVHAEQEQQEKGIFPPLSFHRNKTSLIGSGERREMCEFVSTAGSSVAFCSCSPAFISQAWYWPCCTAKRRSSWVTTGTPEFPKTNCYWFVWVSWISSIQEAALKAQIPCQNPASILLHVAANTGCPYWLCGVFMHRWSPLHYWV